MLMTRILVEEMVSDSVATTKIAIVLYKESSKTPRKYNRGQLGQLTKGS